MPRNGVSRPIRLRVTLLSIQTSAKHPICLPSVDLKDMVSNRIRNVQVRIHSVAIWKFGQELPRLTKRPLTNIPVVIFTSVRRAANECKCCLGFRMVLRPFPMIPTSLSINSHLFFSFFLSFLLLLLLLLAFLFSFATSLRPNSFFSTCSLFFSSS